MSWTCNSLLRSGPPLKQVQIKQRETHELMSSSMETDDSVMFRQEGHCIWKLFDRQDVEGHWTWKATGLEGARVSDLHVSAQRMACV